MKVCSMCVIRQSFFNISKVNMKKSLVECYVDEKWLTNLGLQVFHLKKQATFGNRARIPLSL